MTVVESVARLASDSAALEHEAESPSVGPRQVAIFVVVSLALLMSSIDSTIVAVGLPNMVDGLNTNLIWVGWVLTAYSLMQTIIMPMAGKLSDDFGRKNLFLGAVILFTVGSMLCAIAPNVYLLILFRVIQAIGGGAFMPSAAGIVSDVFGPKNRSTAIGLFTSVFPIGGIIGPNLGGWVIDHYSWRAMFSINVPIGIVLLAVGIFILPKGGRVAVSRSIDLVGAGMFAVGICAIMYGMTVWGNEIDIGIQVLVWFVVGIAALVIFVRHEGRARDPMIELRLLKERAFFAANMYNLLYGALVFGFFSFIPLYATYEYGMSASAAGFILTPRAVVMIAVSAISSFLLIRFGYRLPMILGILLVSVSLFLTGQSWHHVSLFGHGVSDIVLLSAMIMISGFGVGVGGPAANNAAIELMPEAVAQITGLRGMFRTTGGVLGTAAIVLILAHYKDQGVGLAHIFVGLSILVLLIIPPIFLIPDNAAMRHKAESAKIHSGME
jgi:EmrB/QacA subfamily drug resistance transporter